MELDNKKHIANLKVIDGLRENIYHLMNDKNVDCKCIEICGNGGVILLSVIESLKLLKNALNTIQQIKELQERQKQKYKNKGGNNEMVN